MIPLHGLAGTWLTRRYAGHFARVRSRAFPGLVLFAVRPALLPCGTVSDNPFEPRRLAARIGPGVGRRQEAV